MRTNTASSQESTARETDPRTLRALTEYMTVLGNIGRTRGAPDLYLVVSQSGEEYPVDLRDGTCECPDSVHRQPGGDCKHVRRARIATGRVTLPASLVLATEIDPALGAHVDGPRVAATDGGHMEREATPEYTEHVEPAEQGGEQYVRCEGCGRELLEALGGRDQLPHVDGCPNTE